MPAVTDRAGLLFSIGWMYIENLTTPNPIMKQINHHLIHILLIGMLVSIGPIQSYGQADDQKAILITGATSGIGLKTAKLLASKGYFVYAGARKQADMDRLNAMENMLAVRLDVTKQEDIDAAVETIEKAGRGLYGLINNAGVGAQAPLIEADEDDLKWLFDVNVFGPFRVTKAFAPLILESKGRISTTGSIAGILSGMFYGPYSMSKHAMEAFADALAVELEPFGVNVSIIEPGAFESRIWGKVGAEMEKDLEKYKGSRYEKEFRERLDSRINDTRKEPDAVAEAFYRAMSDSNPKRRYMVVPNENQGKATIRQAMREMLQLNENQNYKLTNEELMTTMKEMLSEMGQ